jgi:nucleotide-binding universal stress UspA family protein
MDTTANHPSFVIVLGFNLADTASSSFAFEQAARIASRIPGSQVHNVYAMPANTEDALVAEADGLLRLYINEKVASMDVYGPAYGVHVRRGDPAGEIAQVAHDLAADMVIVGTHHAPLMKTLILGSTAIRVMAHASCPVVIAGPRPKPEAAHTIFIDAPCPECVAKREATHNKVYWCDRHSERHLGRRHTYAYASELPFEAPDAAVDPRGP